MTKKLYLNDAGLDTLWQKILKQLKNFNKFTLKIVDTLPDVGENNILYLVKPDTNDALVQNIYNEYVWIDSSQSYELVGSTDIDFSKYYTKTEINNIIETEDSSIVDWIENQGFLIESDLWEELILED